MRDADPDVDNTEFVTTSVSRHVKGEQVNDFQPMETDSEMDSSVAR